MPRKKKTPPSSSGASPLDKRAALASVHLFNEIVRTLKGGKDQIPQVRPFDLRELGYCLKGRRYEIGPNFCLTEVADEDGCTMSFCMLYSKAEGRCTVINRSFDELVKNAAKETALIT